MVLCGWGEGGMKWITPATLKTRREQRKKGFLNEEGMGIVGGVGVGE